VKFGNSVTNIDTNAFFDNRITRITIPASVTSIGGSAFEANRLTSVTFLGDAPTEGPYVFFRNANLTQVVVSPTAAGWGSTWGGIAVTFGD
jgi:hypothetical protein